MSNMNNSATIIFTKINIVTLNVISSYIKNTYFITMKYKITKIFMKIVHFDLHARQYKTFINVLLVTNQTETKCNVDRKSSRASYIDEAHILIKKDHQKKFFHTFLELYIN